MLDHRIINKNFEIKYRNDYVDIAIESLWCKHCDFYVTRSDVVSKRGCHVKYGGMRAKMIAHIHKEHPEIWEQCQKERGKPEDLPDTLSYESTGILG